MRGDRRSPPLESKREVNLGGSALGETWQVDEWQVEVGVAVDPVGVHVVWDGLGVEAGPELGVVVLGAEAGELAWVPSHAWNGGGGGGGVLKERALLSAGDSEEGHGDDGEHSEGEGSHGGRRRVFRWFFTAASTSVR